MVLWEVSPVTPKLWSVCLELDWSAFHCPLQLHWRSLPFRTAHSNPCCQASLGLSQKLLIRLVCMRRCSRPTARQSALPFRFTIPLLCLHPCT